MDKGALSAWVEAECSDGLSYRQLALSLGVSPTAVASWRDRKSNSLAVESLQAIALRRKESVKATAEWLGVDPPDAIDLPQKINDLDQRMRAMEEKVEYSYQRILQQNSISASAVLDTYLIENGVDVRDRRTQADMLEHVRSFPGENPGLFERMLLNIVGITPPVSGDLPALAAVLKKLTGQPWTPNEITRVMSQVQSKR